MTNEELLKSVLSNSIGSSNYQYDNSTDRLKEKLLNKYKDKSLKDIEGSKKIENSYGNTINIISKEKIDFKLENISFKENLSKNLKLIPGIGLNTETKLKNNGFEDIESLKNHDAYCNKALKVLDIIQNKPYFEIHDLLINNKYSNECRNNILKSLSIVDIENFKFMDIETLGLSNCPIILIGVAEIKKNKIISNQYLLEEESQEKAIIDSYLSHLDEKSIHVSYNGASFDIPFIKNRCDFYNMRYNLDLCHFDLLYHARNLWGKTLPDCKLTTIEENIFNIKRVDDVPGSKVPDFYKSYLKENNIGPLIPIIEHNKQDIISLASFLMEIYQTSIS